MGEKSQGNWQVHICFMQSNCVNYTTECKHCIKYSKYKPIKKGKNI